MAPEGSKRPSQVRYEVHDTPPQRLSAAMGAQIVALILAGIVLTPVIVLRAGEVAQASITWAVFVALLVSGFTTYLQALGRWRIGAGYVLFMGTSGAFISVSVAAIKSGGLDLLMTLIVAASLLQFPLAARLNWLRNIITPAVGGTTIMLIAVTVMPIAFDLLTKLPADVPEDSPGAPTSAIATFAAIVCVSVFGGKRWRLWSPVIGLAVGTFVASAYGLFDGAAVAKAAWIGLPDPAWPGLDLSFEPAFWELLPAFLIVTLVGAIETFGDGIAIQRVSWRRRRAVDFRAVQGAVTADGLGNLLSGLGGTLPNTTYSTSIAAVDLTGVAARRVGLWGGAILMLLAFSPKISSLLVAIPNPVVAAFVIVLLVLLFMHGLTLVAEGGIDYEKALVVGLGFWLGVGFQDKELFYDDLPSWAATLLSNGMTAGTLAAIFLTLLLRLKRSPRERISVALAVASLPRLQDFLRKTAERAGWDGGAIKRLQLAAEETLVVLLERADGREDRTLTIEARRDEGMIGLHITAAPQGANLEDRLAQLDGGDVAPEDALSFRILASIVDEFIHQQYHDVDHLTLRVSSRPL